MGRSIECADPFYLMEGVRRAHPARAIDVTKQPRTARLLQYRAVAVTAAMLVSTTAVTPGLGQLRRERNSAVQYAQFCDPKERSDAADPPRIYCLDDTLDPVIGPDRKETREHGNFRSGSVAHLVLTKRGRT